MKLAFIVSGLAALASGMAVEKRDGTCAMQPAGSGPAVIPDTANAFRNNPIFTAAAISGFAPTNYTRSFVNLQGSSQVANYLGNTLLTSYSPAQCGSFCSQTAGCVAFNTFFERDPSMDPNAVGCPNPSSVTNIKCVLWGNKIDSTTATNVGQNRASFQVVIAGSNGYNRN
ncbi:hypothetical protein VTL71DRAFT_6338 [Oculimacula yallundae]|uniref:Apple domain-containing protein n=1 Tax=Oculimacula yallundae TaxID=86028 RepID=A0ABR4BXK2_9HELO